MIAALASFAAALAGGPSACAADGAPAREERSIAVAAPPRDAAVAANAEGKVLYRQGRYEEARQRYRAALSADPTFLAPALNVACSFVRQERYAEAVADAAALIRTAYVPWAREVDEAADLSALKVRPERATIETARVEAAGAWGEAVTRGLLFVARSKPALHLAPAGVQVLGLRQEVYSYDPVDGRVRAVTAEDGRVLALARDRSGRRLSYLLARKVVRTPGVPDLLRDLSVRSVDLPTMRPLGPEVTLFADVRRVQLGATRGGDVGIEAETPAGRRRWRWTGVALEEEPGRLLWSRDSDEAPALVDAQQGVAPTRTGALGACLLGAADVRDAHSHLPVVELRERAGKRARLVSPFGAALRGLPFAPDEADRSH